MKIKRLRLASAADSPSPISGIVPSDGFDTSKEDVKFRLTASDRIVDCRDRLKADITEACECLQAWYGKPSDREDSESDEDEIESL